MNELERRIEKLEHQLSEKQIEINIADELNYDEVKGCKFWIGFLTCVIIGFVFWTATHICQT